MRSTILKLPYRGGVLRLTGAAITLAHGVFGSGAQRHYPLDTLAELAVGRPRPTNAFRGGPLRLTFQGGATLELDGVGPLAARRLARAVSALRPTVAITELPDTPRAVWQQRRTTMAEATIRVAHESGLHARPLAAFTKLAKGFDAEIQVENLSTGKGPASAKSPVHLLLLTIKSGQEMRIRATGPQAEAALAALVALVERDFLDAEGA